LLAGLPGVERWSWAFADFGDDVPAGSMDQRRGLRADSLRACLGIVTISVIRPTFSVGGPDCAKPRAHKIRKRRQGSL